MGIIPCSRQFIDSDDIKAVVKVLKFDWLTQGPKVNEFEQALCKYSGARYAVCVSSGTAALHLAMLALRVGKGDSIITSPVTFSASANCALYVGAYPNFVDIDDREYHLDIERLKRFLRSPSERKRIKVIIPVHFMGMVSDIEEIRKISNRYGIKVVEDAAHAFGAGYKQPNGWLKVGGCRHSDITILSFHPIKHITTGEGGALLTNNKKIYERVLRLRHHGIVKNRHKISWFYDIPEIGFNYRITDFQCALGLSQMNKLDKMVKIRRGIVKKYNSQLSGENIRLPYERPGTRAAYHLYVIRVPGGLRDKLYEFLKRDRIIPQVNYIPVHLLSFYRQKLGYKKGDFPVAEKYFRECLSLPLYVGLSDTQQQKVIKSVKRFLKNE